MRLFGYLEHGDEKIIVVEYVGNGNLREHLDGKSWFVIHLLCEKSELFRFYTQLNEMYDHYLVCIF